jgi:integration host factor subunit alpha
MTLTKQQIEESLQEQVNLSKNKSSEVLEALLETIKRTLASNEDVMISGFGKFCVKDKKERKGRNPATGEDLMLGAHKTVTFKCSGKLRDQINDGG